jgi:hypothetical protein
MRNAAITIAATLVLFGLLLLGGARAPAQAGDPAPSPSPSPTPSSEPTATPAPRSVVVRALHSRGHAAAALREYKRAAACFGHRVSVHVDGRPSRTASLDVWLSHWADWRSQVTQLREKTARLHYRMTHPGGSSSGVRWMPLARHVGWPSYTLGTLAMIIMRESSGRELAYNGVIGCSGLLQIWPGHVPASCRQLLFDAEYNLRVGLKLWRSQGWQPWSLTAY